MEEVVIQDKKGELSKLGIKDIFFKYIRFLPLFIISIALALFVAYVYLRYSTPVYQSTSALSIDDDSKRPASQGGGDKFDAVINQSNAKNIQNEIEILKSRPLMERVVNDLNLNFAYYAKGKIKELDVYKMAPFRIEAYNLSDSTSSFSFTVHFSNPNTFHIDGETSPFTFGQVFKNRYGIFRLNKFNSPAAGSEFKISWMPTYNLAGQLASQVSVLPKGAGTNTVLLSLKATSPQFATDVLNKLMEDYGDYSLEKKNITNQQSKAFIDERLKVVTRELDSINRYRLAFMQANHIVDPESQGATYMTKLSAADQIVNQEALLMNIATDIENYLRDKQFSYSPVPSALSVTDPTLSTMIQAYNVSQLDRKELLDKNIPKGNVLVKEKEAQIEKLRQNILESLRNVKGSIGTTIQHAQKERNSAQAQMQTIPAKQKELDDIKLQQASKLTVYNYLMGKREESSLAIAANIPNSKILDVASVNTTPIEPNRRSVQLLAFAIGLALPALFIFALEMLNDKVTTRNDIERITKATILGEIGHSYSDLPLVATHSNRSVVAEQFRIIRSNLQYVLNHINKPVILVTSSFSGEGKSFISTNVGSVMALAGKKTVILEFDIRKPKVLSHLGMQKQPGLINYLLGKVELSEVATPVPDVPNLFVLPCGPVPPNPAEMLLDPRIDDLFTYLKQNFDTIIVDTAPVGMVSDAQTLSKYADATLYIVRQGHTFKRQIGLIDEYYQSGKLPRISIVLNDVKLRAGYGYYGYGRYGYGAGYGSSYFQEEVPPPSLMQEWFGWLSFSKNGKKKKNKNTV